MSIGLAATPALAQAAVSVKLAGELQALISPSTRISSAPQSLTWLRSLSGQPHVKVLIVAPSAADPGLTDLRRDIVARGGSVF